MGWMKFFFFYVTVKDGQVHRNGSERLGVLRQVRLLFGAAEKACNRPLVCGTLLRYHNKHKVEKGVGRMRIEQLEYLVEAAQYKSLTEAGEQLHISQQALSASIRKMEEELGVPLIIRTHRGSSLTPQGQVLARGANKLLADYRQLVLQVKDQHSAPCGQLRIGVSYGVMEAFFSYVLAQLYKEGGSAEILAEEMAQQEVVRQVKTRALDLGVINYNAYESPEWLADETLSFTPLFTSKLYVRVPLRSPLAQYNSISLKTAAKEKILVYQPKAWEGSVNPLCETILRFCPDCQFVFEENYQLHYQKVLQGLGIAFTIQDGRFMKPEQAGLKIIPLKEDIDNISGCVTRREELSPLVQYVVNYLRILCVHREQEL